MKKRLTYIVINCLFLQMFWGCYSANYISYDKLKDYNGGNDVILVTKDNKQYLMKRDSTFQYQSSWKMVQDTIEWAETKLISQKDSPSLKKHTTTTKRISEDEISKIGLEEFDVLKTVLLSVGIFIAIVIIYGLTWSGL